MNESLLDEIIAQENLINERISRAKIKIRGRLDKQQQEIENRYTTLKERLHKNHTHTQNKMLERLMLNQQEKLEAINQQLSREKMISEHIVTRHIKMLILELLEENLLDHQNDEGRNSRA